MACCGTAPATSIFRFWHLTHQPVHLCAATHHRPHRRCSQGGPLTHTAAGRSSDLIQRPALCIKARQTVCCAALPAIASASIAAMDPFTAGAMALMLAFCSAVCYLLARFAVTDCDMALLLKGKHKAGTFQGKVVWITGASQGLGEALAQRLAREGAKLILSSRSQEKLERVKASCQAAPGGVLVLPFDLLGPAAQLESAAATADAAFGGNGVDYMIHNAGASQHALAAETSGEVAEALFKLNVLAPMNLTRAMLPKMIARRKGRLVLVASMAAKVPTPGQAVYSATKMAALGYFASVATEVADCDIGVTVCCPGPVGTGSETAPRLIYGPQGLIQRHPQPSDAKRRLTPQRCAELIVRAMGHGVDECWLAKHPVLLIGYFMQYMPWLGWIVLKKVGPKRARAVSSGQSGYDLNALLRKGQ